jgi:hypothetical protein
MQALPLNVVAIMFAISMGLLFVAILLSMFSGDD